MILDLTVTLRDIHPPIWRRLEVASQLTLAQFHQVLQIAMGWTDSHLHQFIIDGQHYAPPSDEDWGIKPLDERKTRLRDITPKSRAITYEYDFGDGARACPPEDSGGPHMYIELLQAVADPVHDQHQELRDWLPEDFNPETFNGPLINQLLARHGPKLKR